MTLREKIPEDLKSALRSRNELELSVLRMLQAAIRNKEIEIKRGKEFLTDEEVIEVISGEVKRRKEAVSEYTKANRQDLADREKVEVDILMRYMPKQMGEEEIRLETRNVIDEVKALSLKDIGIVMKNIMPRLKGKADGSLVNRIVREELEKKETS
ncbi:MAG: GatB/YqeY domain-containing protein [Thermodesulfobacteriota bacterium]